MTDQIAEKLIKAVSYNEGAIHIPGSELDLTTCRKYTYAAPSGRPLLVLERLPHPSDRPAQFDPANKSIQIAPPQYFGEWQDITKSAQEEYTNRNRANRSTSTTTAQTKKPTTKEDELAKAQALLAALQGMSK